MPVDLKARETKEFYMSRQEQRNKIRKLRIGFSLSGRIGGIIVMISLCMCCGPMCRIE